jgi:hypothetical protein
MRLLACWTDWADAAGFTIDRASTVLDSFGAAFGESRNKREILNSAGSVAKPSALRDGKARAKGTGYLSIHAQTRTEGLPYRDQAAAPR